MIKFSKKDFNRALKSINKDVFLSMSNMFVMTITFLFLGFFIYIIAITQTAIRLLESKAQVTIFFKDDYPEKNILDLVSKYQNDQRIKSINYVSKQQAYQIFNEINKDEPLLLQSASPEILPASIEIKTKNINDLNFINDEFLNLEGVEDISYFKDIVNNFRFWSNIIYIFGFILVFVFIFISYSIILYTLKSTISSKGMELSILKIVGASDHYVKNPFLYQGLIFGLISSIISSLFLILLSFIAQFLGLPTNVIQFGFLYKFSISPINFSFIVSFVLIIFGAFLGYFGSYIAIKKYLKF